MSSDGPEDPAFNPTTISRETVAVNIDRLGINYDALPKVPFWGPLFGYTQQKVRLEIGGRVLTAQLVLRRDLEQSEKDAMSYYFAKAIVTRAYAPPLALGTSYLFWRRGFDTYRFPFYQPPPSKFNPFKFLSLQGPMAQNAWHALRGVAYYGVAHFFFSAFLLSYTMSSTLASMKLDSRLEHLNRDLKPAIERLQQQRRGPHSHDAHPSSQVNSFEDSNQVPEAPRDIPESTEQPSRWQRPPRNMPGPYSPVEEDESSPFDDASPVAPSERRAASRQPGQQGSAWDRLRQQASPGGNVARQGDNTARRTSAWDQRREDEQTSRGARDGTSYSFSASDEEKSYAKEQAQKDFDAMLERERRGDQDSSRRR